MELQEASQAGPYSSLRTHCVEGTGAPNSQAKEADRVAPLFSKDACSEYRPDIDGLRAVAVLAVIVYHLKHEWMPGGFVGVDIFFLISGYVVAGSLKRHQAPSLAAFLAAFYARRVKRLAPALALVVLSVSIALAVLVETAPELDFYFSSAQLALLGVSNLAFASAGEEYFARSTNAMRTEYNPFTHTWSLGVEEQFYFLFPLLIVFSHGHRVLAAAPSCVTKLQLQPTRLLAGAGLCSLLASAFLSRYHHLLAFYLLPSRFWQLSLGALLHERREAQTAPAAHALFTDAAALHAAIPETSAQTSTALHAAAPPSAARRAAAALLRLLQEIAPPALLSIAFTLTPNGAGFPFPAACPAVLAAAAVVWIGPPARGEGPLLSACLASAPATYLGRISYPLYLWHWPVFVLCKWTVGLRTANTRLGALGAAFLLAAGTYHLLERPVRSWKPRRNRHVFCALLFTVAILEAWLGLLRGPVGTLLRADPPEGGPFDELGGSLELEVGGALGALRPDPSEGGPFDELGGSLRAEPSEGGPFDGLGGSLELEAPPRSPPSPPLPPCSCTRSRGPTWTPAGGGSLGRRPCLDTARARTEDAACEAESGGAKQSRCLLFNADPCFLNKDWNAKVQAKLQSCMRPRRALPPPAAAADNATAAAADNATAGGGSLQRGAQRRALFLLGDSHAADLVEPMRAVAEEGGFVFAGVRRAQCAPGPNTCFVGPFDPEGALNYKAEVMRELHAQVREGDVVALAQHGNIHLHKKSLPWYRSALLPLLRERQARLVLIADWPALPEEFCFSRPEMAVCGSKLAQDEVVDSAAAFARGLKEVFLLTELRHLFCASDQPNSYCGGFIPGTRHLAYEDRDHLSRTGALYLQPFLCSAFQRWGLFDPASRAL